MKRLLIVAISLFFCRVGISGTIVRWSPHDPNDPNGSVEPNSVPEGNDFVAVSAGYNFQAALQSDGNIIAWGDNLWGQCNVPEGNYVAVDCGYEFGVAIRSNGSLAAWGRNDWGECNVPTGNDYIAIAAGEYHGLALKADGSIAAWGITDDTSGWDYGQVSDTPSGNNFVRIATDTFHNIALKNDGTLVAWGSNKFGQCNVPDGNDFVFIESGGCHNLAIKSDGTLLAWGRNEYGQCDVPSGNYIIADGGYHTVAIDINGSLAAWGNNDEGQCDVPGGTGFVSVSACYNNCLGLTSDESRTLLITSSPANMRNLYPSQGEYSYYYGQQVLINAARSPNCPDIYNFHHWTGPVPDPCSASQYIIMDSDKTITAHYLVDTRVCGDECHPILQGDLNEDCYINFDDFALYAASWLSCTHPDCD